MVLFVVVLVGPDFFCYFYVFIDAGMVRASDNEKLDPHWPIGETFFPTMISVSSVILSDRLGISEGDKHGIFDL